MTIEQVRQKFKGAYVASYEEAQKNLDGEYMSDRNNENMPLVCQKLNFLTVEDYDKWYGLYYLMEDPDTKKVMLVRLCHGNILEGVDHEYYPASVVRFCNNNNIKVDAMSLLCINKSLLMYDENKLMNRLISLHYTKDIIIHNTESKSRVFYVDGRYDTYHGYSLEGAQLHEFKERYFNETSRTINSNYTQD